MADLGERPEPVRLGRLATENLKRTTLSIALAARWCPKTIRRGGLHGLANVGLFQLRSD